MDKRVNEIPKGRWLHILPPIMIICIISYMDRVNIGFAMAGGMSDTLGMTASVAGLAAGIFFIGYLFLQVPGGQFAAKHSGKKFITYSILVWAVISVLTGLAETINQLLILRFALGVAEGGMLPVALTMVSNWFPNEERGRANAFVILFVPVAAIITGPLSGYILAVSDWHWLFIIEGIGSLAVLIPWLLMVSDRPEGASWISKEEKEYIIGKIRDEEEELRNTSVKQASLKDILPNVTMWKLIALNFCYQSGIYGFGLWLPTLLKNLTHSGMTEIGWLSALPYVGCAIGMLTISNISDRTGRRKEFVVIPLVGFALCLLFSVKTEEYIWVSYAFLVGCGFFLQAAAGVFWTIPPRLFSPAVAGGARGIINAIGNLGGFVGPYAVGVLIQMYSYDMGVYSLVALLFIGAAITLTLPASVEDKKKPQESIESLKV
ncbi:MFS transporter [Propionispira raffinosivorans]|uniref:MFS transporter n=1 Tax=Propionispira raffinosivorans TaxID=86959 RepID=UPI00036DF0A8|nr:MFS transporter [Propionispira raffinosivorans]